MKRVQGVCHVDRVENVRFELGVVKDALFVTLDDDLESGVDELLRCGWGQR